MIHPTFRSLRSLSGSPGRTASCISARQSKPRLAGPLSPAASAFMPQGHDAEGMEDCMEWARNVATVDPAIKGKRFPALVSCARWHRPARRVVDV
ncbi:hypothetical protein F2981_02680 [Sinorhizobium meliloti]|nr:hypothetical protein [Sinorhizobium meliloti]